jgi:inhibitor of KinA sporulation pathway (predicted exonuclease)
MNYIIVDLEATCWENRKGRKSEIIEIGAVIVNDQRQIMDEFTAIIKPVIHPTLSDFCTTLTTISQEMVDQGLPFIEALENFKSWINSFGKEYLICSWGYYDKSQFISDCKIHGQETSWLDQHISLKHQYALIKSLSRPISMKNALKLEGLSMEGTHHRGIDDAKNITKIFIQHFEHWKPEGLKKTA